MRGASTWHGGLSTALALAPNQPCKRVLFTHHDLPAARAFRPVGGVRPLASGRLKLRNARATFLVAGEFRLHLECLVLFASVNRVRKRRPPALRTSPRSRLSCRRKSVSGRASPVHFDISKRCWRRRELCDRVTSPPSPGDKRKNGGECHGSQTQPCGSRWDAPLDNANRVPRTRVT